MKIHLVSTSILAQLKAYPPKSNIDTKNDGFCLMHLLSNMGVSKNNGTPQIINFNRGCWVLFGEVTTGYPAESRSLHPKDPSNRRCIQQHPIENGICARV